MTKHSVYLGKLDIDIRGKLDLLSTHGEATSNDIIRYLFAYALVADEVCMQGSAPLKSKSVFGAFSQLAEAFQRNELHEEKPVFSFVLSNETESYLSYVVERLSFLKTKDNENIEKLAYLENDAKDTAQRLDKLLNLNVVKKRTRSVSNEYKASLLIALSSGSYNEHGIEDEVAVKAIEILSQEDLIQTHSLLKSLNLIKVEQINAVYRAARERYRNSNAYGSESLNSETKPHFKWKNVWLYLSSLGLEELLQSSLTLDPKLLFTLRALKSFKALNEIYFECQDQDDIDALLLVMKKLRLDGKFVTLKKQSFPATVSLFFETLNQTDIGYKSLNKALEHLAKMFVLDVADEVFAKKIYLTHKLIENFHRDFSIVKIKK